jgi:hypothetical protein
MIYQLPNGKIINISIEQFLLMTDEDEQELIACNFGSYPPCYNKSCYANPSTDKIEEDYRELEDYENDEFHLTKGLSIDEVIIFTDLIIEFPDIPEEPIE